MNARIWVAADHHMGHANILNFKREDGSLIRGAVFKNTHEHDEVIIARHNEVVKPEDHVYFLGDFAINKKCIPLATRMIGHKRLVRGNHDQAKTRVYIENGFEEIYGVRVFTANDQQGKTGFVLSHVPIHPNSVPRWGRNVHGHLHQNIVLDQNGHPDPRYICVSLEHTNYYPVLLSSL